MPKTLTPKHADKPIYFDLSNAALDGKREEIEQTIAAVGNHEGVKLVWQLKGDESAGHIKPRGLLLMSSGQIVQLSPSGDAKA